MKLESNKIILHGTEDEMLFFHRRGQYHETLWASCPEQARDFMKKHGRKTRLHFIEWVVLFDEFCKNWESEYRNEEEY